MRSVRYATVTMRFGMVAVLTGTVHVTLPNRTDTHHTVPSNTVPFITLLNGTVRLRYSVVGYGALRYSHKVVPSLRSIFLTLPVCFSNEYNEKIVETLANFVFELLCDDELQLGRLLRKKLLVKLERKKQQEKERERELKLKLERSKLTSIEKERNAKSYLNK